MEWKPNGSEKIKADCRKMNDWSLAWKTDLSVVRKLFQSCYAAVEEWEGSLRLGVGEGLQ